MAEIPENQTTIQEAQGPNLPLGHLESMLQILDLATQRGAFRGQELSQVGTVYDGVLRFVEAVKQQEKEKFNEEKQDG